MLIKIIRVTKGFNLLKTKNFMKSVKGFFTARLLKYIEKNPEICDNLDYTTD